MTIAPKSSTDLTSLVPREGTRTSAQPTSNRRQEFIRLDGASRTPLPHREYFRAPDTARTLVVDKRAVASGTIVSAGSDTRATNRNRGCACLRYS
jgi:hypothetical protein